MKNIEKLIPITREVSKYIKATTKPSERDVGLNLIEGYRKSNYCFSPYVQMWILDVLISKMPVVIEKRLSNYANSQINNWEQTVGIVGNEY